MAHTVCLRSVSPKPWEDTEALHVTAEPSDEGEGPWGRRPSLAY